MVLGFDFFFLLNGWIKHKTFTPFSNSPTHNHTFLLKFKISLTHSSNSDGNNRYEGQGKTKVRSKGEENNTYLLILYC